MRVLGIGAHPDDLELYCGGTLARYAARGDHVQMAFLCSGNLGAVDADTPTLVATRRAEAEAAARLIGAELLLGGFRDDLQLFDDGPTRGLVVDLIRQAQPDVVLTHGDRDHNPDHLATHQLVLAGVQGASLKAHCSSRPAIPRRVPVFFFEPLGGVGFIPTDYVDIETTFETKLAMWRCHASQLEFLEQHRGMPNTRIVEVTAAFRGIQCGVRYAEGFRRHEVYGVLPPARLLP